MQNPRKAGHKAVHWAKSNRSNNAESSEDDNKSYVGLDMEAIHAQIGGIQKDLKRVQSVAFRMDSEGHTTGAPEDPVIFSDRLKPQLTSQPQTDDYMDLIFENDPNFPRIESRYLKGKCGGFAPISLEFHTESHRERKDREDMGLEDEDFAVALGVDTTDSAMKEGEEKDDLRRRSLLFETTNQIGIKKGDFCFPRRTYTPKTKVPHVVGEGQVPESIIVERLIRAYRVVDLNQVLNTLGVTPIELIPPSHYGETNPRFYLEKMFRNRSKIDGVEKFDFFVQHERTNDEFRRHRRFTVNHKSPLHEVKSDGVSLSNTNSDEGKKLKGPGMKLRPPFEPMFPLYFFDNADFDELTGAEWISLGWDEEDNKNYAVPAKAYMPFRFPSNKQNHIPLSKTTNEVILAKTEKLEKLRQFLLVSRYHRMLKNAGIDINNVPTTQSTMELAMLAKATFTVPSFSDIESSKASKRNTTLFMKSMSSIASSFNFINYEKESPESSDDEMVLSKSNSFIDLQHELSQFKKQLAEPYFQGERVFLTESDYELNARIQNLNSGRKDKYDESEIEATRSESLLSEVFSQLESLTLIDNNSKAIEMSVADEMTDIELSIASEPSIVTLLSPRSMAKRRVSKRRSTQKRMSKTPFPMNEHGLFTGVPESAEEDDFDVDDAAEKFIFDFDKMKRPCSYDWKWVDVAVLDFDEEIHKYLVCCVNKPRIFAWVSKIYLCFDAEDPYAHAERIKDAILRRTDQENILRYNLYLDCIITDDAPIPTDVQLIRILQKINIPPNKRIGIKYVDKIRLENDVLYERVHSKLLFDKIVEKSPTLFKPFIVPTTQRDYVAEFQGNEWECMKERSGGDRTLIEYRKAQLRRKLFLCHDDTRGALLKILSHCASAKKRSFVKFDYDKDVHLDEYERLLEDNVSDVILYLKNEWYEEILSTIRKNLGCGQNPRINLREQDYEVFKLSRLPAFLMLLDFIMQDCIRVMVLNSLEGFVNHIVELTRDCKVHRHYKWGRDLTKSEFPTPYGMKPMFTLEIKIDKDGPRYTQLLQKYMLVGNRIFTMVIQNVQRLPKIIPIIMPNFSEKTDPYLQIINEDDPEVMALRFKCISTMKNGLIPLDSYAQRFRRFMPMWNRKDTLQLHKLDSTDDFHVSTTELHKQLEILQADIEKIEHELPAVIHVTAFSVNTDIVKCMLIKKLKESSNSFLHHFAEKLKHIVHKVMEKYTICERKLNIRSDDIIEVMQLKDYVELVPGMVSECSILLNRVIKNYEIFEEFHAHISDDASENKWATAVQSHRLLRMAGHAMTLLDEDYERLYKIQQAELVQLSDQVDSNTMAIQGLAGHSDLEKAHDAAADVKKVWLHILDLEEKSRILNERGEVFKQHPSETEAIKRLLHDIEPYKRLWFNALECISVRDSIKHDNLVKIDDYALRKCVTDRYKIMEECVVDFHDNPELQHVALEVQYMIKNIIPILPLIEIFKSNSMKSRHWEQISKICGVSITPKLDEPFKKTLDKGILNFASEIIKIGNHAIEEMEILNSIDQMALHIETYRIQIRNDEEAGIQTVRLTESVMDMINKYVEETKELMNNPNKSAFTDILNKWENKIQSVKLNAELWNVLQDDWRSLQPLLPIIEKQTLTPNVFKFYKRADRVWRRLIRLVRQFFTMEQVTTDMSITASLNQLKGLLEKVHSGMEEYARRHQDSSSDSDG